MKRGEQGFSLLELMIALALVASVIAAATTFFIGVVNQYKVQTKITESNVEGVIGLELMRRDIESLGFGLPWNNLSSYDERSGVDASITALNESPNAPRAVVSIVNAPSTVSMNNSDYLVIRSASVGMSGAAGKWTTLSSSNVKRVWGAADDDMVNGDYVVVLAPGTTDADRRSLVGTSTFLGTSGLVPTDAFQTNIVYGIDNVSPKRPFNRADYYIADSAAYPTPLQCAPNTGVLVKAAIAHDTNGTATLLPLLDCVADMQVVYGLDNNAGGVVNTWIDTVAGLTAAQLRAQLVELHVHILAQQGKRDDSYTYPGTTISVGSEGWTDNVDVSTRRHYRWKVYNIVVRPKNLAS
ncbi:MAG: PilW family protein [bacterium]|nr:PilW family protein [bacterium]